MVKLSVVSSATSAVTRPDRADVGPRSASLHCDGAARRRGEGMKQATQRLKNGRVEVLGGPAPALASEGALVHVWASLLSTGNAFRQRLGGVGATAPDQLDTIQITLRALAAAAGDAKEVEVR